MMVSMLKMISMDIIFKWQFKTSFNWEKEKKMWISNKNKPLEIII